MINTHEEFLKIMLKTDDLYETLKAKGYKGRQDKTISNLIYAIRDTDAYVENPRKVFSNETLTEKEYFEILVSKMNGY